MASKTGESSSAQASSDVLYCKWGTVSFNNLLQEYGIKPEWNLEGRSLCLVIFFKFCNFGLPINKFCKSVLDEYHIHISQVHPLGLVKLRHFELAWPFFVLVWKSHFFTFDRRDVGVSFLRSVPASSRDKDWKKKIFYIDAGVIPGEMHWREMGSKEKFKDEGPPADAYIENALFKKLSKPPSECQVIPEGALVLVGMSLLWRDSRLYPAFQRFDNGKYQPAVNKSAGNMFVLIW
ncbi:putative phospholipase C, phosphatidylinositol-specific, Y domain-containing protein [Helianthus anomalus]